jgi:hypothetical protein
MPLGPAGRGWITALDFDFSAQANQTLSAGDTQYTIGGLQFFKSNSANEAAPMAVNAGSGLTIQPVSNTDYTSTVRTAPILWLPFSQVPGLANLEWSNGIRVWHYIEADNGAANFDNSIGGIDANDTGTLAYVIQRGHGTASICMSTLNLINAGSPNGFVAGNALTLGAANNVFMLEVPRLLGTQYNTYFGAFSAAAGLPPAHAMSSYVMDQSGATASAAFSAPVPPKAITPQSLGVLCSAKRAGSGTALSVTFGRIRIDYKA